MVAYGSFHAARSRAPIPIPGLSSLSLVGFSYEKRCVFLTQAVFGWTDSCLRGIGRTSCPEWLCLNPNIYVKRCKVPRTKKCCGIIEVISNKVPYDYHTVPRCGLSFSPKRPPRLPSWTSINHARSSGHLVTAATRTL